MEHINSGRSWSPELRVFLIHCVRARDRLWRKYGTCGQDSDVRMTLWAEVQQEIGKKYKIYVDLDEIKKTWKNLKDNFLRVKKASKGTGCKPGSRKWYFYDELRFLDFADAAATDFRPFQTLKPDLETEEATFEPPPKKKAPGPNDHLIISIPAIDNRIHSKQEIPLGATILDLDDDLEEIAKITAGKWGAFNKSCQPGMQRLLVDSNTDNFEENEANSEDNNQDMQMIQKDDEKPQALLESDSVLGEIAANGLLTDVNQHRISMEISRMRGIYHRSAMIFFMIKGMKEGELTQILLDFDEYVFLGKQRTKNLNKVVKAAAEREEFENMFDFIEKYREKLHLVPPSSRWEQEDKELGKKLKPYYLDHRNPLKVDLTVEQLVMRERLKHIQHRKADNQQRTVEIQREIDRINGELCGQPSVIRRTKLKKMLVESEKAMEKSLAEKAEIEEQFREQVKILENSAITADDNTGTKNSGPLEQLLTEAKLEPV